MLEGMELKVVLCSVNSPLHREAHTLSVTFDVKLKLNWRQLQFGCAVTRTSLLVHMKGICCRTARWRTSLCVTRRTFRHFRLCLSCYVHFPASVFKVLFMCMVFIYLWVSFIIAVLLLLMVLCMLWDHMSVISLAAVIVTNNPKSPAPVELCSD